MRAVGFAAGFKNCSRKKHSEGTDVRYTENRDENLRVVREKKILVSENPLKKLHGKISDFGKLSSLGF